MKKDKTKTITTYLVLTHRRITDCMCVYLYLNLLGIMYDYIQHSIWEQNIIKTVVVMFLVLPLHCTNPSSSLALVSLAYSYCAPPNTASAVLLPVTIQNKLSFSDTHSSSTYLFCFGRFPNSLIYPRTIPILFLLQLQIQCDVSVRSSSRIAVQWLCFC